MIEAMEARSDGVRTVLEQEVVFCGVYVGFVHVIRTLDLSPTPVAARHAPEIRLLALMGGTREPTHNVPYENDLSKRYVKASSTRQPVAVECLTALLLQHGRDFHFHTRYRWSRTQLTWSCGPLQTAPGAY